MSFFLHWVLLQLIHFHPTTFPILNRQANNFRPRQSHKMLAWA